MPPVETFRHHRLSDHERGDVLQLTRMLLRALNSGGDLTVSDGKESLALSEFSRGILLETHTLAGIHPELLLIAARAGRRVTVRDIAEMLDRDAAGLFGLVKEHGVAVLQGSGAALHVIEDAIALLAEHPIPSGGSRRPGKREVPPGGE